MRTEFLRQFYGSAFAFLHSVYDLCICLLPTVSCSLFLRQGKRINNTKPFSYSTHAPFLIVSLYFSSSAFSLLFFSSSSFPPFSTFLLLTHTLPLPNSPYLTFLFVIFLFSFLHPPPIYHLPLREHLPPPSYFQYIFFLLLTFHYSITSPPSYLL